MRNRREARSWPWYALERSRIPIEAGLNRGKSHFARKPPLPLQFDDMFASGGRRPVILISLAVLSVTGRTRWRAPAKTVRRMPHSRARLSRSDPLGIIYHGSRRVAYWVIGAVMRATALSFRSICRAGYYIALHLTLPERSLSERGLRVRSDRLGQCSRGDQLRSSINGGGGRGSTMLSDLAEHTHTPRIAGFPLLSVDATTTSPL